MLRVRLFGVMSENAICEREVSNVKVGISINGISRREG